MKRENIYVVLSGNMHARCSVEIVRRNVIIVKGFGRRSIGSNNHEVEAIDLSGTVKVTYSVDNKQTNSLKLKFPHN